MTALIVALLVIVGVLPLACYPLTRTRLAPPTVAVAGLTLILLGIIALLAAEADPVTGAWGVVCRVLIVIAAITGGSAVVRSALLAGGVDPWNGGQRRDTCADESAEESGQTRRQPALRGGRVIGYLERVAILAALFVGWPAGMAVIVGVKGLARYPEIRDADAGEQFIIGTFTSVIYAVSLAGISYLITH